MPRCIGAESTTWSRSPRCPPRCARTWRPARVGLPAIAQLYESVDGTRRYLLRLDDGRTVETVLMPEGERDTICISSQVGCPVDCKFCMTALLGLERNLTAGEIVGQVLLVARENGLRRRAHALNIVMMGQGEPLLNLPNVLKATRILLDPAGFGLLAAAHHHLHRRHRSQDRGAGARTGPAQAGHLAQRLHRGDAAGTDAHHAQVSFEGSAGGLPRLSAAAVGEADVRICAAERRERQRRRRAARGEAAGEPECKVNLIALNPGPGIPFETPGAERVASFQAIVRRSMPCFIRKPRGLDIYAACGQLKRNG